MILLYSRLSVSFLEAVAAKDIAETAAVVTAEAVEQRR